MSTLSLVPVFLVFPALQRLIIRGLSLGPSSAGRTMPAAFDLAVSGSTRPVAENRLAAPLPGVAGRP